MFRSRCFETCFLVKVCTPAILQEALFQSQLAHPLHRCRRFAGTLLLLLFLTTAAANMYNKEFR